MSKPAGHTLNKPGRRFLITFNNNEPTFELPEYCRYAIFCREIAPTTGHPHVHCYIETFKAHKMGKWKKVFLDKTINIQICTGHRDKGRAYCMKTDPEYEEFGDWEAGGNVCDGPFTCV